MLQLLVIIPPGRGVMRFNYIARDEGVDLRCLRWAWIIRGDASRGNLKSHSGLGAGRSMSHVTD